jgi:hypothetical protein
MSLQGLSELSKSDGIVRLLVSSSLDFVPHPHFAFSKSGKSIPFGFPSKLSRTGGEAFSRSGLGSIHCLGSVERLCEQCFSECESLEAISFHFIAIPNYDKLSESHFRKAV